MNGKQSLESYKPIGCRVSETVRRHQADVEEAGDQKRLKGSFSHLNIAHGGGQGHMVPLPVSSVSNWEDNHRVVCGERAKRKRRDDVTDIGSLWHLEVAKKMTFKTLTPPNQLRSKKKLRTNRPEQGIYSHLAQVKRKQATWYPTSAAKQLDSGQNLALETASSMAQLRLACEMDHGPTSTVYDHQEQTVPVVSPSGNTSQGSEWLDEKPSMLSQQSWCNYVGVTTTAYKTWAGGPYTSHRPQCAYVIGKAHRELNPATKTGEMMNSPFSLFHQGLGKPQEETGPPWNFSTQVEPCRKPQLDHRRLPSMPTSHSPTMGPPIRCHDNKLGIVDTLAAVVPPISTSSPTRKSTMFGCESNKGLPTIYEMELRSKVSEHVVMRSKTTSTWDNDATSSFGQSSLPQVSQLAVDEE